METKKQKAINHIKNGDWKKALMIISSFKIEFNKTEQRTIQIAKEILTGHESFYNQLGIDTMSTIENAKRIVADKYSINS